MNGPFTALAWEYVRRVRGKFLLGWLLMAGSALFFGSIFLRQTAPDGSRGNGTVLITFLQLLIGICLLLSAQVEQRGKDNPMMPARWHLLPVSTLFLVSAQTLFGVIAFLLLLALVNIPITGCVFGLWFPWQIAFFDVTVLAVAQAFAWGMGGFVLGRIVAAGIAASVLFDFYLDLIRRVLIPGSALAKPEATMATLAALAFAVSLFGVSLDRRGIRWPGLRAVYDGLTRRFGTRKEAATRPFPSTQAAQFWLEWKTRGTHLPLVAGLTGAFVLAVRCYVGEVMDIYAVFATLFVWCFPLVSYGVGLAAAGTWRGTRVRRDLGAFTAAQPLATCEMGQALLRVSLASVLVSVLLLAGCCLIGLGPQGLDYLLTDAGIANSRFSGAWILVVSGVIAAVACGTWMMYMLGLAIAISGRMWVGAISGLALFAAPFALLIASVWLGRNNEFLGNLVARSSGVWLAAIAGIGSAVIYAAAVRLRVVGAGTALIGAAVAFALCAGALWLTGRFTNLPHFLTGTFAVTLPALLVLPFAAIPAALHWNRHR